MLNKSGEQKYFLSGLMVFLQNLKRARMLYEDLSMRVSARFQQIKTSITTDLCENGMNKEKAF